MNTKLLMTLSAIFSGVIGLSLSFLPKEIDAVLNANSSPTSVLFLQLLSALYLGFALMNWMTKGSLIGGIYNRPIAIGNFMHFTVGALALIKTVGSIDLQSEIIISITVIYTVFAAGFAYVFMHNPIKVDQKTNSRS